MAIVKRFEYIWPQEATPIELDIWGTTLSQAEQDEFAQALARQEAIKQKCIDDGVLVADTDSQEWKDQNSFMQNRLIDPVWQSYFERWINETGVQFSVTTTET